MIQMQAILHYLKLNGEQLDSEIAAATGISLAKVRVSVSELSAKGGGRPMPADSIQRRQADRWATVPDVGIHATRWPWEESKRESWC